MSWHMTAVDVPAQGINRLTQRLIGMGVKREDSATWPEGVWMCDSKNFAYSREWKYVPTWESPCGLLIRAHGDFWGETWAEGEFKCAENDNPLFACPTPWKACEARKQLPKGINCQFHRTERAWTWEESAEKLYGEATRAARTIWEEDYRRYPGWNGTCANMQTGQDAGGRTVRRASFCVRECIACHCGSEQCVVRLGAARDLSKANIFYDMYVERHWREGMLRHTEKQLTKGLKLFDRPVARTDAEICLKIWRHDPGDKTLPYVFDRLNAVWAADSVRSINREVFFTRRHGKWNGREDCTMRIEIRNVRTGRNEQRDLLQDLRDVEAGLEVVHQSDSEKAAAARKTEARRSAKTAKFARKLAAEMLAGQDQGFTAIRLAREKDEFREQVRQEAERIAGKAREKQARAEQARAQVSLFDLEGRDNDGE